MDRINAGQSFDVFVDFTVTPGAYERVLQTVRQTLKPNARILTMTGSCGDRMREKRPRIGEIVARYSDVAVVTEDETLREDPQIPIEDVWSGMQNPRCKAVKIPNRLSAMRYLFNEAKPNDVVLLCGMGACTTMQTREGLREWDERAIAMKELQALMGAV
jgi:UDP-N-acetylmuramoyl-L-alanyl-D-glutamate--2,6-diaminopimelate ligase